MPTPPPPHAPSVPLPDRIRACRLCAERFARTATAHRPRPVAWFRAGARLIVTGQAPGMRVHRSGRPFDDASGVRLRRWMGVDEETFWDRDRVAVVPMGFCFPGYDAKGADLPPPKVCAATWREAALSYVGAVGPCLLIGGYAQAWHLGPGRVTDRVRDWRAHAARGIWCLPHPSWRNTGWLKANPWFEAEAVPALQAAVREALA